MIENIEFETKGQNQSEIRLQHSTGEITTLLFNSILPMQAQEYYIRAINSLLKQMPELSPKDDLFSVFTGWFLRNSLEIPLGVGTSKNEERIRIGNRIKEIREEKHLEAKMLSMLTGIDAANLCRIEQGKQSAGIDVLSKIANAMGYKIDFVELKKINVMKKFALFVVLIIIAMNGYSQSAKSSVCDSTLIYITKQLEDIEFRINGMDRFKLYSTDNIYTFLKLDTATGKIDQLQWSLDSDNEGTVAINSDDLSLETGSRTFELYPTKNMYQFILLDKVTGRQWHVQWGMETSKRWIRRLY